MKLLTLFCSMFLIGCIPYAPTEFGSDYYRMAVPIYRHHIANNIVALELLIMTDASGSSLDGAQVSLID